MFLGIVVWYSRVGHYTNTSLACAGAGRSAGAADNLVTITQLRFCFNCEPKSRLEASERAGRQFYLLTKPPPICPESVKWIMITTQYVNL